MTLSGGTATPFLYRVGTQYADRSVLGSQLVVAAPSDWSVELALVLRLPKNSWMCEAPVWPGFTIGSLPPRWLLRQFALNSDPRTGAACCSSMALRWPSLSCTECPAWRSAPRAAAAASAAAPRFATAWAWASLASASAARLPTTPAVASSANAATTTAAHCPGRRSNAFACIDPPYVGSVTEGEPVDVDEVSRLSTGEGQVHVVHARDGADVGRHRPPALPPARVGDGEAADRRARRAAQAHLDQAAH